MLGLFHLLMVKLVLSSQCCYFEILASGWCSLFFFKVNGMVQQSSTFHPDKFCTVPNVPKYSYNMSKSSKNKSKTACLYIAGEFLYFWFCPSLSPFNQNNNKIL